MIPLQTTITILATIYRGQGVIVRWEGLFQEQREILGDGIK